MAEPQAYFPLLGFELSHNNVDILEDRLSELITITLTKLDNENISTQFKIEFEPSDPSYLNVVINDELKTEAYTKELLYRNSLDVIQFKLNGRKMGNQPYSPYILP